MPLAVEPGVGEPGFRRRETLAQLVERGHDETDMAAQQIGFAGRQVELALADIDPHVVGAGKQERVAGQAEGHEVKVGGEPLTGNPEVDVFETDKIAEIFGGAVIEWLGHKHLRC